MTDDTRTKRAIEALPTYEMDTMEGVVDVVKLDDLRAILDAPPAQPASEPVAWQWRHPRSTGGEWYHLPDYDNRNEGPEIEFRPLYTHPSTAPTGNTALVEADNLKFRICALLLGHHLTESHDEDGFAYPLVEALTPEDGDVKTGELEIMSIAEKIVTAFASRPAALSQPAAPQPTPEVEAWQRVMLVALKLPEETQGKRAVLQAIAKERAIARGPVAEKGERT